MFKMNSRAKSVLAGALVTAALGCGVLAAATDVPKLTYVGSALWTKAHDIKFQDKLAYCAFGNGLIILDLTDVKNPARLSQLYLGGGFGIDVKDRLAFVAAGAQGLNVIDVTDPKSPVVKGTLQTGGEAREVIAVGNLAFVAAGPAGVLAVDVSDPAAPRLIETLKSSGEASSLALKGDLLYVADGTAGLEIITPKLFADGLVVDHISALHSAITFTGDTVFFGDNFPDRCRHWLPVIDHPHDKAACEFVVTAPEAYQVVAPGAMVESTSPTNAITASTPCDLGKMLRVIPIRIMAASPKTIKAQAYLTPNGEMLRRRT
jgi:hypothetical protein